MRGGEEERRARREGDRPGLCEGTKSWPLYRRESVLVPDRKWQTEYLPSRHGVPCALSARGRPDSGTVLRRLLSKSGVTDFWPAIPTGKSASRPPVAAAVAAAATLVWHSLDLDMSSVQRDRPCTYPVPTLGTLHAQLLCTLCRVTRRPNGCLAAYSSLTKRSPHNQTEASAVRGAPLNHIALWDLPARR